MQYYAIVVVLLVIIFYYICKQINTDGFGNNIDKIYKSKEGWFMAIKGTFPHVKMIISTNLYNFKLLNDRYDSIVSGLRELAFNDPIAFSTLDKFKLPEFEYHFYTFGYMTSTDKIGTFSPIFNGKMYGQRFIHYREYKNGKIVLEFDESGTDIHFKEFSLYTP
jgi:hypothetical protein